MTERSVQSIINRLKSNETRSDVPGLIKEAYEMLIEQDKRIADLTAMVDMIDSGLCNYINNCNDPYEPVSKWDESATRNFQELCTIYNDWHNKHKEIGDISMKSFVENDKWCKQLIVHSLKQRLYRAKHSKEAQTIIEDVIRAYEDSTYGSLT